LGTKWSGIITGCLVVVCATRGMLVALLGAGLTFVNIGIDEVADPRLRIEGKRGHRPE